MSAYHPGRNNTKSAVRVLDFLHHLWSQDDILMKFFQNWRPVEPDLEKCDFSQFWPIFGKSTIFPEPESLQKVSQRLANVPKVQSGPTVQSFILVLTPWDTYFTSSENSKSHTFCSLNHISWRFESLQILAKNLQNGFEHSNWTRNATICPNELISKYGGDEDWFC